MCIAFYFLFFILKHLIYLQKNRQDFRFYIALKCIATKKDDNVNALQMFECKLSNFSS